MPAEQPVEGLRPTGYLNAFRGLAAFWVLTAHCMIWGGWHGPIIDPKMAVDLFMVLSGFLMALTVSERQSFESVHSARTWIEFYVRRLFRIAPAYYVVLLAVVVLAVPFLAGYETLRELDPARWLHETAHDPRTITYNLPNLAMHVSFLFGLFPAYANSTQLPDWSLGLEMQFYAVFPAIFLLVRRYQAAVACSALILACYLLTAAVHRLLSVAHLPQFTEPSLLVFKLPVFLIGVLIYEAACMPQTKRWQILLCIVFAALQFREYGVWSAAILGLVWCVYILWTDTRLRRLAERLDNRLTRFMSDASYSVYLLHGLFLALVGSRIDTYLHAQHWAQGAVVFVIWVSVLLTSYASAGILYRYVERPGVRLGRIVENRLRRAPREMIA
ncbi:MAG: acyltransferase [Rhizomicrobium sp.]